ncbi:MAG: hypothetical protein CL872_03450 [Dehalococcoidaceae bacterium]|nr:hypothetical protein [Dehalococcoidaceae bacterium]
MKTRVLILSLILCLSTLGLNAQNSIDLGFGQNAINIPDTVTIGDSIWFSCWVVNNGEDVLAENVLIKAARYDTSLGLVSNRTIGGQGPNFIYPNDSIQFVPGFLFEVVTNQNYLIGDNIVVIWPKADVPNSIGQTNQYVYKNLHVLSNAMSSIAEQKVNGANYFYPQPAKDKVFFKASDQITAVKIFNILGKEVAAFNNLTSSISIADLPQGIYLLKIQTQNREEKLQKLIIKR